MKLPLPILVLLGSSMLVAASAAFSSEEQRQVNLVVSQATPTDRLYSVDFKEDEAVAVGEAGLVVRSTDAGKTWSSESSTTTLGLISVARSGKREIAVGQMGIILVRVGNSAWREVDSGTELRLLGVDINSRGLAVAVGAFGTLLRSTNGGETWRSIAPKWGQLYDSGSGDTAVIRDEPTNYVVKVLENNRIIIGGEYGQLMDSRDGGRSWSLLYRQPEADGEIAPTLFDIKLDGKIGYAVGQAGLVIRTNDGGESWYPLETPTKSGLFAVTEINEDKVFAIGQRVAITSTDGGQSWRVFDSLDLSLNWYTGLGSFSSSEGNVVAVGHSARILSLAPF